MPLKVKSTPRGPGTVVVSPIGSIDASTFNAFDEKMDDILKQQPDVIIFDMEFADYISSSGIRVLLKTKKALKETNGRMVFMNLQPQIQKVFDILKAIPGVDLKEMERNRDTAMCCGAGGGLMWMEEETGHRINVSRTEQALAVNPSVISSGCPYCLTMLSDGTKAKEVEENVDTLDVAELLEKSVFGEIKPLVS